MDKRNIKLIITDLDNTLYDWFHPWYKSFKIFIDDVLLNTNIQEEILLKQIKTIHQKYGTSEYSFDLLLSELEVFQQHYPKDKIEQLRYKFYKTKKDYLKLYSGILEFFTHLKQNDCKIIAYTESMEFYAKDRVKKLRLDGIIDVLFTPKDHNVPEDIQRYYTDKHYTLQSTKLKTLENKHKKPNKFILEEIINQFQDINKNNILYIGDSLTKDIQMANEVGILSVYAEYGTSHLKDEYELLKKVTHWTEEDVLKEKQTTSKNIQPNIVLKASILELFNYVTFDTPSQQDSLVNTVDIWKKTIDVQMHFNDIELKIRQFAVTLTTLIIGGFFALRGTNKITECISIGNYSINTISIAFVATAIIWLIFYFMEQVWYHPLLKGAVIEGMNLEKQISKHTNTDGLTTTIGKNSPSSFLFIFKLHSKDKAKIVYWGMIVVLLFVAWIFN